MMVILYHDDVDSNDLSVLSAFHKRFVGAICGSNDPGDHVTRSTGKAETVSDDICIYCGGPKSVRNPTGNCDHLYWPDMIPGAAKNVDRASELAAARNEALEEAARVADVNGIAEGEMVRIDDDPFDAADAVGKRIAAAIRHLRVTGAESNP